MILEILIILNDVKKNIIHAFIQIYGFSSFLADFDELCFLIYVKPFFCQR